MARQRVGFIVLAGAHLLELAGAVDALAAANIALGETAYDVTLLSVDGAPVMTSQRIRLDVDHAVRDAPLFTLLAVVAGRMLPRDDLAGDLEALLRTAAAAGTTLMGIGSGAATLAQAGLLDGYRCTIRWEHVSELAHDYPSTIVSEHLHVIDRQRLSCSGGTASMDLTIHWLGQRHGGKLAQQLTSALGQERLRPGDERQRHARSAAVSASAKLAEALALMQANLREPLMADDIANLVGVSRRQLERLFKQHLDELPARWYLQLRLERARSLLQQSSLSILQIGLECGFASGPHFSRAYRGHFGHTPREERAGRAAAWRSAPSSTTTPAGEPGNAP